MRTAGKNLDKLYVLLVLFIVSGSAAGFLIFDNARLKEVYLLREAEFTQKEKTLAENIVALGTELDKTKIERDGFEQKFLEEQEKISFLSTQVEAIQGALGVIEKINKTDKELLQKYSKVYFLNENYIPEQLVAAKQEYVYNGDSKLVHSEVWPHLWTLLADAESAGVNMLVISAYRSFGDQSYLKAGYQIIYGSGANQFSADQGYSEHQLGTAVDFTTSTTGADYNAFSGTQTYQWLLNHAYKYGFILSYPKGNTYYQFEPWHWRFVGRELATKLYTEDKNFYDLDQREINEYLAKFFD